MTKEIICTNGMKTLVDDEFYPLLAQHNWYINMSGKKPYVITKLKTDQTTIWRCIFMHHLIMGSSTRTDHIDGNTLNNCKSNLRLATVQENGWNTKKRQRTSSGGPPSSQFKGVSRCNGAGGRVYWRVIIKLSKKGEVPAKFARLGPFDSEIAAARAYNEEIVKHRGAFSMLNVIPNPTDIEDQGA